MDDPTSRGVRADQVEALFAAALEQPLAERADWVRRACGPDEPLRVEVAARVATFGAGDHLVFEHPTQDLARATLTGSSGSSSGGSSGGGWAGPGVGDRVGRYTLRERLGEGGFGVVFLAEQLKPIRRRVAVKIIKAGMDTAEVVARFDAERQALAKMAHPNIARVLDAGATEAGRPYFVMELVRGRPITAHADAERLSVRQRVALLLPVCDAVQHAHRQEVIHRDLKPSNVLVTGDPPGADGGDGGGDSDGGGAGTGVGTGVGGGGGGDHGPAGVPKVIDFGIAKAIGAGRLTDLSLSTTHPGGLLGTPAYMSPEQAEGTGDRRVDVRTDVYNLGLILYELLTGTTPLEPAAVRAAAGTGELARLIRDQHVPAPTARLATLATAGTVAATAAARSADARGLAQQVRRELDWITMRAIERDRARRYESPAALGRDLARYLAGEAVEAGPPSRTYRARKWAGRHRRKLVAAAVLAVAATLGVVGLAVGYVRANRARVEADHQRAEAVAQRHRADAERATAESDRAEADRQRSNADRQRSDADRQRDTATAVLQFVQRDLFVRAAPDWPDDRAARDVIVARLLDPAAATVGERFAGQPAVRAAIQYTLGELFRDLGRPDAAVSLARASLDGRRAIGAAPRDVAASLASLGRAELAGSHVPEAEASLRQAVDLLRQADGPRFDADPAAIPALSAWAISLMVLGRSDPAIDASRSAWDQCRRLLGDADAQTHDTLRNYVGCLCRAGRFAEAEPLARQSLADARRAGGPGSRPAVAAEWSLASVLAGLGRPAEAVPLTRDAWEQYGKRLGDDNPQTIQALAMLAATTEDAGHPADAEPLARDGYARARRVLGDDQHTTLGLGLVLARALMQQGQAVEAEPVARRTWTHYRTVAGDAFPATPMAAELDAMCLLALDRPAEAIDPARAAYESARRAGGDRTPTTTEFRSIYAAALRLAGHPADADALSAGPATAATAPAATSPAASRPAG